MASRRIAVLTATRAEYGLLTPLLREIEQRDGLALQLIVTGAHLSSRFGMTVDEIAADGFAIAAQLETQAEGDGPGAAAATMAAVTEKVTAALEELKPDALVLLGDRYETMAAAGAALISGVPIAHIHGGELTEGAIDDSMRHAITMMAHLHFAAAEPYRQRLIQLGQDRTRVFNVGALAMDNIRQTPLLDRAALENKLGVSIEPPMFLVTYHPVTTQADKGHAGARALTEALDAFPEARVVFTGVNADPGHDAVETVIREFVARNKERASLHASLGREAYLSMVNIADLVIGNSSSGVIEAPALATPSVNMGDRQLGRLGLPTVTNCAETPAAVTDAISRARTGAATDTAVQHILGDGFTARRIADVLAQSDLSALTAKTFFDIAPAIPANTQSVTVIAEAGVNHNGSLEIAKGLVDAAAAAGADFVKFQSFHADNLATQEAPKAAYQQRQVRTDGGQHAMLKGLELSEAAQADLLDHCADQGIRFLSTPFDMDSLDFLTDGLKLETIKIGSGDLTNAPLLLKAAQKNCDLILSTGMATVDEIARALAIVAFGFIGGRSAPGSAAFERAYLSTEGQAALADKVTLLQCTTDYPAQDEHLNLRAMDGLSARFGLPVGFSDHSQGPTAALAAAARGARIIEKHITLDRGMAGPDHAASMEPAAFTDMVSAIRNIEAILGDGEKRPMEPEIANRSAARKSLVAAKPIAKGEAFAKENLTAKRPGTGVSALEYFDYLGKTAGRDYDTDDMLT